MADWDDVREIARAFPEAEESTTHTMPAFKFRGKLIFWMSPREEGALCVRVDRDERPLILESDPTSTSSRRTTRAIRACSSGST